MSGDIVGKIAERYGKFKESPVVYTIFVLGFPIQSSLHDKAAIFQDRMKSAGYPIFEPGSTEEVSIEHTQGAGNTKVITKDIKEYAYFNRDRTDGVILKEDKVIYHTSNYIDFPSFSKSVELILTVVKDVLDLDHYGFVGMRCIDAIMPKDKDLNDILEPELLPFALHEESDNVNAISNQINGYNTTNGALYLKSYIHNSEAPCIPRDLFQSASRLSITEMMREGPFATLDFDHHYIVPNGKVEELDLSILIRKLTEMHDVLSLAFIKAIKEEVLIEWGDKQ